MFDITTRDSFNNVSTWIHQIEEVPVGFSILRNRAVLKMFAAFSLVLMEIFKTSEQYQMKRSENVLLRLIIRSSLLVQLMEPMWTKHSELSPN